MVIFSKLSLATPAITDDKEVTKVTHLLVLVLNKPEYQSEILRVFRQVGVRGATIIDSVGMGRAKAEHHLTPLVAGLMRVLDNGHHYNKTILSVIEDESVMQRAIDEADRIVDFSQPGSGIIFTLPVDLIKGMRVAGDDDWPDDENG
jgi:nitrogen regulatory protein PII